MTNAITRYRSTDGKEFTLKVDAEEHDAYLRAASMITKGWGGYPVGYDGPIPVSNHVMTAEEMFRHRHKLRNILLDLPDPAPEVLIRTVIKVEYKYPTTVMIVGAVLGLLVGVWF